MPRPLLAATAIAIAALGLAPAAAQAKVTSSTITSWTSSETGTPPNAPYLISFDNASTTVDVKGTVTTDAAAPNLVDIVCFYGSPAQSVLLTGSVVVDQKGGFDTTNVPLKPIAGHACRLRAIPHSGGTADDNSSYAAAQIAVSEADLPVVIANPPNAGAPVTFYITAVTFTSFATWSAVGTPSLKGHGQYQCGGPNAEPIDGAFDIGNNFAIDCAGSLLGDDAGAWGGRSEVQVDGRNAYDPAAAASLFSGLSGFPKSLAVSVKFDPTSGLVSSTQTEPFVVCSGTNSELPTAALCSSLLDAGVTLQRTITTSEDGRVITMTDSWSSSDGTAHTLDLLYDDVVGVPGSGDGNRGWQFPGQTGFSQYGAGASVPAPAAAPGSILVRTNVSAADGDPNEAFGAITFDSAPTGFRFAGNSEMEEHRVLVAPAVGSVSLTYMYSVGYTLADVTGLSLVAQDRFQGPALTITSPASGTVVSTPTVTLTGTATSGSGISSLSVGGHAVPVGSNGAWSTQIPLSPGTSTITAMDVDNAGQSAQAQITVAYQPSPAPPPPPLAVRCKVPRTKGMKLSASERALRRAHCKVGKIKHVTSKKVGRGRVMSTRPRAGRQRPASARVELFVSKGA